ncbi:MAG TPA: NADH-quinone oxidoreductase subunit C [Actinomycetota bacterium]|nr:NADH-quinone oxidoreductase subunit C [Actinomycetota bacterium]
MPVTERIPVDEAVERARAALSGRAEVTSNQGAVDVTCARPDLVGVVQTLRDTDGLRFNFFSFLSAVDWSEYPVEEGEQARELEVLILLYAPERALHVAIHVPVPFDDPTCPSITSLFGGAIWHERECHDLFGIVFGGHPRLVNIYLPEDFDGHPGLKSFKLPTRSLVKEWPGAKDPDEAAAGGR